MIRVTMANDIRKYETKFIGPFTKRQSICWIIGVVFGALVALVLPLETSDKLLAAFICAIPIILCGYINKNRRYLEELFLFWMYRKFLTPRIRTAKCRNHYREILDEMDKKEKLKQYQKMTPKERKAAQKKEVVYSKKHKVYR